MRFIRRIWYRYWVPRAQFNRTMDALLLAHRHIVHHHDVGRMKTLEWGACCPVCSRKDGTTPELNTISEALHSGRKLNNL